MHRASFFALSTLLLLVGLSPAQNPPPERRDDRPVLSKSARLANRKTEKAMQGAWRLVDMQLNDASAVGLEQLSLDHVGFCLVSGQYFSIEFHVRLLGGSHVEAGVREKNAGELGRSFISGLHRYEFDEDGAMETSTVIGARTDENGKTAFEPPETKRRYTIDLEGDTMTMRRDDGHTLIFERLLDDRTRFDFYGKPVPDPSFYDDGPAKKDEEKKDEDGEGDKDEDG